MSDLHVAVIFDSRYGTTARLAQALARGLGQVPGIVAETDFVPEVHSDVLERSELLIIGGPTEFFSASHHLREFFNLIGAYDLHGKFGFAFDTHAARPLSGSAARFIERHLKALRVTLLEPRESGLVEDGPPGPNAQRLHLATGSEAHFEELGRTLGKDLLTAMQRRRRSPIPDAKEPGWAD